MEKTVEVTLQAGAVDKLLSQANLARIRSQWTEATDFCVEVLRQVDLNDARSPENALEECDRDLRAWSSVWNSGRVAQKSADQHNRPCLGRCLVRLVKVRGLEVDRRFDLCFQVIPSESPHWKVI